MQAERLKATLSRLFVTSENCSNPENTGIGSTAQIVVFFVCAALVVSRRPDAFFHPQFFAEDGTIFYPEAYMSGLAALFHPLNGYYQTLPRVAAAISLLLPFRFAPLVLNLIGITIQVLPVNLLLSVRSRNWAPLFTRTLMAILYLGLPNSSELDVAPEEGQWHLALLACGLVLACPPLKARWRVIDMAVLLLGGFTGPFCLLLLPIAWLFWWLRRDNWRLVVGGAVAIPAVIQALTLMGSAGTTRPHAILGANTKLFVQLLAARVYLGAVLGESGSQLEKNLAVLGLIAVLGTMVVGYCLLKARVEWKLLIVFCALVFATSLVNPMVSMTVPQWQVLWNSPGIRYWFFPMIGFVWTLAWCATLSRNGIFRLAGVSGLLVTFAGITTDWRYPPYTKYHFGRYAAQFEAAAPGTMLNIPIFPDRWTMRLVKRSPACRDLLIGNVDRPLPSARVSGATAIAGWVVAAQPIRQVFVYVDRRITQSITPDFRRPDADAFYPRSPDKFKGWRGQIDFSNMPFGPHEIEVRGLEADGCEADFAIIPVERTR